VITLARSHTVAFIVALVALFAVYLTVVMFTRRTL
jgi:hypothetical protein